MSSRQCLGAFCSTTFAAVMVTSVPHTLQRNFCSVVMMSSGSISGGGVANIRSVAIDRRQITYPISTAMTRLRAVKGTRTR